MTIKSQTLLLRLLEFLERLEKHGIHYRLEHHRPESIQVNIAVPGERWEGEFLENGDVEIERFVSDRKIYGEETLDSLFATHGAGATDREIG
jgi:hypothetical protein